MNIFKRLINYIKSVFIKKEEVKKIDAPKQVENNQVRTEFMKSLKVVIKEKRNKKKIETLVCVGDGLGIKQNMSY